MGTRPAVASHSSTRGFRYDIQGLRALAVSMVVIYHLWPTRLPGGYVGVDVFFVISGFLITSHLLKSPPRTGSDLREFWARRIRRLLPAALLVLAVTAIASRLLAPQTQWAAIANGVISSALYVQNWALAASSVDYLAAADAATPTQHFWSLSVEEQFYLFWPLMILVAFWAAFRWRRSGLTLSRGAIAGVAAVSLLASVALTATSPASAYFVTPTRMWELAVGGLVAAAPAWPDSRVTRSSRPILAWAGVGAMVFSAVFFTPATAFPGYAALLPVAGTAFVILAGVNHRYSPSALLRSAPVQWLGNVSYSVYLWHWPLVVLVPYLTGARPGLVAKAVILSLTLALAALTNRFVEDRFRAPKVDRSPWRLYRFAAAGMTLVVLLGVAQISESSMRSHVAADQFAALQAKLGPCLGAGTIGNGPDRCPPAIAAQLVPDPVLAKSDKPDAYADDCWTNAPFTGRTVCTYGHGPVHVALVGNSHAGHWLPALQPLAARNGWTITTYLVSQCNLTSAPLAFPTEAMRKNCLDYGRWVMEQTRGSAYDLVITSERQSVPVLGQTMNTTLQPAVSGYLSYLREWSDTGTNVLIVDDPPTPGNGMPSEPDCLAAHPGNPDACAGTPQSWRVLQPLRGAADELGDPRITTVNMDRYFCTQSRCPAVIGSVIARFDASHMTATYARTLAPYLERPILDALGR